jgi:hypothetical protein
MKQVIPTHDPQTGELNPFYQELTGQSNPLSCKPHLIWWNELPKEKQYTLNYHYFGQPDLGETDFLTEDDIKKIWSKEVTDRIIVDYVKNGKFTDAANKILSFKSDKPGFSGLKNRREKEKQMFCKEGGCKS